MPGPLKEARKIVVKGPCCWSGSYKILRQEPKCLPQELSYKHLLDMAPARSSMEGPLRKDPDKIFCQGPVYRGSRKDLVARNLAGVSQDPAYARIDRKNAAPQDRFVRACEVDMHLDISEEPCHTK